MTSRILDNPLGVVVQGASSGGKSFVIRSVGELVPPESKIAATSLSANALHYFEDPNCLVHKVLLVGERRQSESPEAIDENRALRELLSENQITRLVTTVDQVTGTRETRAFTVHGPVAYVESTTREEIFEEDASRLLPVRVDESATQTRAVMGRIARDAMGEAPSAEESQAIIGRHHAAQRILEEFEAVPVIVPFARGISISADKIVARRAFKFLIGVVRVVAVLRVFQKSEGKRNPIVADLDDYEIARRLMAPVIRRQLGTLGNPAERLFQALRQQFPGEQPFVAKHVTKILGVGPRHAHRRMKPLLSNELARETADSRRNRRQWYVPREAEVENTEGLPTRYEVEERLAIKAEDKAQHPDDGASDVSDVGGGPMGTLKQQDT